MNAATKVVQYSSSESTHEMLIELFIFFIIIFLNIIST